MRWPSAPLSARCAWRRRISLNELARRAGVDPAYIHRIEGRSGKRPPLPRRPVVLGIAAALGSDPRQTDQLLALAGHTPTALLELGGWDNTLASVAELLADRTLSGSAKAEFREVWASCAPLGSPRALPRGHPPTAKR